MNSMSLVCVSLAFVWVGCIRAEHRPAADARALVAEQLACDDVQVAFAPRSPYRDEPLFDRRIDVVAWGCGQVARLRCDPFSSFGGSCEADDTYELPDTTNLAVVKVLGHYAQRVGVAQRERIVVDGAEVVRSARFDAIGIPVRAGLARWAIESQPVVERRRTWTTTDEQRIGNTRYRTTRHHSSVDRELEPGCDHEFVLDAAPGATYRVELDYRGPGQCSIRCAREVATATGVVLAACEGFGT